MTVAVSILGSDEALVEALTLAVEQEGDVYVAPAIEQAQALLVTPDRLERIDRPDGCALVVLAARDHIGAARAALRAGADGILAWPDDAARLAAGISAAVGRRATQSGAGGRVIAVTGARGGCGATTIAAYLAAALAPDAFLIDLRGGAAGQSLFAADTPQAVSSLAGILADPAPDTLRRIALDHAAGVPCVYAQHPMRAPTRFAECLRIVAPAVIVDGAIDGADVTLHVVAADVGSVRSAAGMPSNDPGRTEIVLNRAGRGRVRARDVERALGVAPIAVVAEDGRVARATDLGVVAKHGNAARAIRKLAQRVAAGADD